MHPHADIVLRPATADDAPHLAGFARMAGHGLMELFYEGLLPYLSVDEIIIQRRIEMPGSFNHWQRWVLAEDAAGTIMGGLNAFPHDVFDTSPPDPLLDGERIDLTRQLWELEREAAGTYYLNMIAVAPAARGRGVGKVLMREFLRQAAAHGYTAMTLSTYESDAGLMAFYRQHGFEVTGRAAIPDHPAMELKGHWVLMRRGPPPGPAAEDSPSRKVKQGMD